MTKIDLINEAFEKAERLESKLTEECFSIGGFTSPKIRHLMSNLGAISKRYLELGTHRGSLSVATTFGNENLESITLCDMWSEFQESDAKENFFQVWKKYFSDLNKPAQFLEKDCFTILYTDGVQDIDLYLFDAEHSLESQEKAITYFVDKMADEFVLIVDDMSWSQVQKGTFNGIKRSGLTELAQWQRHGDGWHNGVGVFLLKK